MKNRLLIPLVFALAAAAACSVDPDPPRTLLIGHSNDMRGEIRSCGCAEHDLGGLGRRATLLKSVRDTTGDFLLLEAGDFFSVKMNYGREKADLTLKSLALMDYDAVVLGEKDFSFGVDYIVTRTREIGIPAIASNLLYTGTDSTVFAPFRDLTLSSGLRVGIVGVVGKTIKLPPQAAEGRVSIVDPVEAATRYITTLRDSVDFVVVLAHMPGGEASRFASAVEGVDIIVNGHDGQPPRRARPIGGCYVVQGVAKGLYMSLAYMTLDESHGIRTIENVQMPLSEAYPDNEAIAKLFSSYDLNIAAKETSSVPVGVLEARKAIKDVFVGADACEECHSEILEQWRQTEHAHAFDILTGEGREHDRDCTPCHTTGFYKRGGFESLIITPELVHIQCEACHGNGYAHTEDPTVATDTDATRGCVSCHTAEQTPNFDFATFWERIEH